MNSSILADIEDTLSDKTTKEIVIKDWYWNEFLPKIDEDNIKRDYRLVYESFTITELIHLPYDINDEKCDWLINNQILVIDNFNYENASNIEKWIYKEISAHPVYKDNIVKYMFSDKFFEDYQRNVNERRKLSAIEDWMYNTGNSLHRLYNQDKAIHDLKKYAWPTTYKPSNLNELYFY